MRKGITPIISIIILLLITVALAGAAWTFLQGFIFPQITDSFVIPTGGAYCISGGTIKVYVLNTGYQSELEATDFIIMDIDGAPVSVVGTYTPLTTGESGLLISDDNSTAGYSSGYHTLDLGTGSTVLHQSIFCP